MELVSPAGNLQKLQYVYEYGADAAYIGLKKFSLRVKADNFYENEFETIIQLKERYPGRRLFCALNISFHNQDIQNFLADLDYFKAYPFDAFIVQDLGMVPIIQKHFPHAALHLSTQANCINSEAVKMYRKLGFSRVVVGREASLAEIAQIKQAVPEMEIEAFVHGAMCIAYSGRCLMSSYMTGRSANGGHCSHSCRWDYRVLEEKERPGEYFPVYQGEDFTAVLSSKDLCMIDHLSDMKRAGVDSLKIEGRMKSLYYGALVTRAYRKAIDLELGRISQAEAQPFIDELYHTAHREFATGFYYNREDADKTTRGETTSQYEMAATIGAQLSTEQESHVFAAVQLAQEQAVQAEQALLLMHPAEREAEIRARQDKAQKEGATAFVSKLNGYHFYQYTSMNKLDSGVPLEYVGPNLLSIADTTYQLVNPQTGQIMNWVSHGHPCLLYTDKQLQENWIVRREELGVRNLAD